MKRLQAPQPNLRLACGLLLASTVSLILARVVGVARVAEFLLSWLAELLGVPAPVLGRVTVYTLALVCLTGSYIYAIYSVRRCTSSKLARGVLVFAGVLSLPMLLSPDLFSHDVYGYIFYGRMVGVYGLNPYVTMPAQAPPDPALAWVDWRNLLSPYGPLWTSWSAVLDRLVPGGMGVHVLAFKLSAALTHLLNIFLVGAIVRRASPRHATFAMAAYGWNPLTITEFAGNAHNDSLMLSWVLLSLLSYYNRRPLLGALLLGLAIATKFTAVLFVPFYLLALLWGTGTTRQRIRRAVAILAVVAGVWLMNWLPYLGDGGWKRMLSLPEQSGWYLNSLPAAAYAALKELLVWIVGLAPVRAGDLASVIISVIGLVLIVVVGFKLNQQIRQRTELVEIWFWFMFAYLFFVGPYFWPWYATTLVSLAAMSRGRYVWLVTTLFSASAMLVYSCSDCRTYLNGSDSPLTGLAIFVMPLVTLLVLLRRDSTQEKEPALEGAPQYG